MAPSHRTWFILAAALAASPAAAGGEKAPPAQASPPPEAALEGQDLDHPPPGSPADQALWRAGHDVTQSVQIERARATRLQTVLLNLRYTDRANALAARGGEAGARGAAAQRRLGEAHATQFAVLTARWPVDTYRVCGYPAMEFGSMLSYGKSEPADLAKHRAMLLACVDQAQASVKAMKESNDGLEAAMREADAVLVAAGLGPPTGAPPAVTAAATGPAKEPTIRPAAHEDEDAHGREREREHARRDGGAEGR